MTESSGHQEANQGRNSEPHGRRHQSRKTRDCKDAVEAFVGIDVAFAKGKHLPVAFCRWECGRLIPYSLRELDVEPPRGAGNLATLDKHAVDEFASRTENYVRQFAAELGVRILRIGIDSPGAPCRADRNRRGSELALSQAGIHCFATPTSDAFERIKSRVAAHLRAGGAVNRLPHANQLWMLVGFALFRRLAAIAECIEVFPQATVHVLGAAGVHKLKRGGVEAQLAECQHQKAPRHDSARRAAR